ncbi:MAG: hypothetical protein ACXVES_03085 [Actinomycetota bacterium]
MAAKVIQMTDENRCDLCGYRSEGGFLDRARHLKSEHPAYTRGLLFRLAAPGIFLVEVLAMAAVHAPGWAFLVALFSSFALLFFGKQRTRGERRAAGTRPTMPLKRLIREGGLGFILIVPVIALIIAVLGRR